MSSGDSPTSAKDPVIFLVHGTWPRLFVRKTKAWFEDGSFFRDELKRQLSAGLQDFAHTDSVGLVHFEALQWSGANSFFERERAADALVDRIHVVRRERPAAHFFFNWP